MFKVCTIDGLYYSYTYINGIENLKTFVSINKKFIISIHDAQRNDITSNFIKVINIKD